MSEIILWIVEAVIAASIAIITKYVVPWIKSKLASSEYSLVVELVETAVAAAQQTITGSGTGAEKKATVLEYVQTQLEANGITISDEQLDVLIESAVYALNNATE